MASVAGAHDGRLVIRDLEVENFKSYYGQHRIGPFHQTFSAVIGPNGSGKSNVIDAMLFVFGRSARKIRLDKLSSLIHRSAAHDDATFASVTITFVRVVDVASSSRSSGSGRSSRLSGQGNKCSADDDSVTTVATSSASSSSADELACVELPGSELRVTREVYRSGTSQYYIDGVRKQQRDVVACLIAQGIDLEHNRFLILQGEVEQIALMKPRAEKEGEEGLLEYLDDLIGTNEYAEGIAQASRAAEAAQVERMQLLDVEQKLRAEREALDDAKNSTLAFVTKDNHLQKTLIVMCQLRMRGIEDSLVEPRRLLREVDARIAVYEEELRRCTAAKATAEELVTRAKKDAAERVKERDAARARKLAAEAEVEKLKSSVDEHDKARRKLVEQMRKSKEAAQKALLQQHDAEREATIHQQNYDEVNTRVLPELQARHEQLSAELLPQLTPLQQQLAAKRRALVPYERAVVEAAEALTTAQARVDALDAAADARAARLRALDDDVARHTHRLRELQALLARVDDTDARHGEVRQLHDALAAASRRKYAINGVIQEHKNMYCEGEADDRAMEFLLAQRSLKGYYGTLRQLGRIDEAYDVAAGVASRAWGYHVVEDRATAATALTLLKQHNIARATMMVLSEVERDVGARARQPFALPSHLMQHNSNSDKSADTAQQQQQLPRRLFDLITPTNVKFRTAFYAAVRDTLVVPTLSEARQVAFGGGGGGRVGGGGGPRYRVVTLKGELVEPAGTITGGGGVPRGAKLKAARAPLDKQSLRAELQRLQQELVQAAEEERHLQGRLAELQSQDSCLSAEQVRKLRSEQRAVTATLEHVTAQQRALREEADDDGGEAAGGGSVTKKERADDGDDDNGNNNDDEDAATSGGGGRRSSSGNSRAACVRAVARARRAVDAATAACEAERAAVATLEAAVAHVGGGALHTTAQQLREAQASVEAEQTALRTCRRLVQTFRATHERKLADVAECEVQLARLQSEAEENVRGQLAVLAARAEEMTRLLNAAEAALAQAQSAVDEARAAVPSAHNAVVEAQRKLDDEQRFRQTEASKMADSLQELAKFEQKIEGCEEKIRSNAELYGLETLQLDAPAAQSNNDEEDADDEEGGGRGGAEEADDEEDDDEDEEQDEKAEEQGDAEREDDDKDDEHVRNATRRKHDDEDNKEGDVRSRVRGTKRPRDDAVDAGGGNAKTATRVKREARSSSRDSDDKSVDAHNTSSSSSSTRTSGTSTSSSGGGDAQLRRPRRDATDEDNNSNSAATAAATTAVPVSRVTLEDVRHMSFKVSAEELALCDYDRSVHLAKALSEETRRLHSAIDFRAVALWRERDVAHRRARAAYTAARRAADEADARLATLKERRRCAFVHTFAHIRARLRTVYQLLTHGGDADLELVDASDPFEGVLFVVRPPRKSWKAISNLSGGEKTLSSLALIFALHDIKPTPIYVMDEIDAALDFRNVAIVAQYVLQHACNAQFVIISLRNHMFERAHQLIGVCKVYDQTATLVLRPRAFARTVAQLLQARCAAAASANNNNNKAVTPSAAAATTMTGDEEEDNNVDGDGDDDDASTTRLSQHTTPRLSHVADDDVDMDMAATAAAATSAAADEATATAPLVAATLSSASSSQRPSRKSVRFSDPVVTEDKENRQSTHSNTATLP